MSEQIEQSTTTTTTTSDAERAEHDGSGDFDFFIGNWTSRLRILRERLKGSTDWDDYVMVGSCRKVLNGAGNLDEFTWETPAGRRSGLTLRLYDPTTRQWALYWASDTVTNTDSLTPVVGHFVHGRGEFFERLNYQGTDVIVRYLWVPISETACHWEQAFSADEGATWETNWIIDHTRTTEA